MRHYNISSALTHAQCSRVPQGWISLPMMMDDVNLFIPGRIEEGPFSPQFLIIHATQQKTRNDADPLKTLLNHTRDPWVSCHFMIGQPANNQYRPLVYHMVSLDQRAKHAGISSWLGQTGIDGKMNDRSIGNELCSLGEHGTFHDWQYRLLNQWIREVRAVCPWIGPEHVLGHEEIAPGRKTDPGMNFDWQRLADEGNALWPRPDNGVEHSEKLMALAK